MGESVHVLYVMYGMPSCYNNGLAFARKFMDDGITITVLCDQDISALAAVAGVPFCHLESLSFAQTRRRYLEITQSEKMGRSRKLLNVLRILRECKKLRKKTLEDDEYLQLVAKLNPDIILIDIECHLAIIASSTLSIPTAICTRLFNHRPGDGIAPLHSNLLPSKQFSKRLCIAAQWWKLRIHSGFIALRQSLSRQRIKPVHYRSFTMPDIKAIARQYQVDLKSIATTAQWFRPVTYTHVPIFSMTLGDLDFDRNTDSNFNYLGPMIGEHDYAFDLQSKNVSEIDNFVRKSKLKNQPIIYCAMGTYARSEPRFIELMRTIAQLRQGYAFIISLGGRESDEHYQSTCQTFPGNALLLSAAPQIKCLSQCDAAILHGGIASLQEALKFRVPVLCFSVGSNDQNGTTVRWVHRRLASRFSHAKTSADSLCLELDRLLTDTELANRLDRYGNLIDKSINEFSPKQMVVELCT